jgi:hypothetical protein
MRCIRILVLPLALGCIGCGTTRSVSRDASESSAGTPKILFWSTGATGRRTIRSGYACGARVWLPLRWGKVPKGTRQLVLMFGSLGPPTRSEHKLVSTLDAAAGVVGLSPKLHQLSVGSPPRGAYMVRSALLPVCPSVSSRSGFMFRLFALPVSTRDTVASLRRESLSDVLEAITRSALAVGEFGVRYPQKLSSHT